ncbi:MAG: ATP-dependent DNA helicase [Alphaproteobacteria bacterium]
MEDTDHPALTLDALAQVPVVVAGAAHALWRSADGKSEALDHAAATARAKSGPPPIVCHAPATARRLGSAPFAALDVLELFAFARPAAFCLPTPRGLAAALGLPAPAGLAAEAETLARAAQALLEALSRADDAARETAAPVAAALARADWPWGIATLDALGTSGSAAGGLDVWERLPEWSETAPVTRPGDEAVEPAEARARLATLLGSDAEPRPQQADYASAASAAFQPREAPGAGAVVLAEAGTGVGKTLGYIAPASLWAEKNRGPVWLSTFTKNLQRQIDQELDRLYPGPRLKARKVVVRKGRENYLCLLNMEDAVRTLAARRADAVALGLMARWTAATRDGDMAGGDFPAWLADLVGRGRTFGLTDRRGECIYSACPHYRKCFIERGIRRARRADMVIANHALVMTQAALHAALGDDDPNLPTRYVFDEGHHVFNAADGAFSARLTGIEAAELRRWVLGAETTGRRSRARGLERRIGDLVADDDAARALEAALRAARALPGAGWLARIAGDAPRGPAESFLAHLRRQVLARSPGRDHGYSLEAETHPAVDGLIAAAGALDAALERLAGPLLALADGLAKQLDDAAAELDSATRLRIEALCRGLRRRGGLTVAGWRDMLTSLAGETPEALVDWFAVERVERREIDVGMHRHWIDPTIPFAQYVVGPAHGVLVTSATLRDGSGDDEADWRAAEVRTGADYLAAPAVRAQVPSPFDYARQTRVFVVTDVRRDAPQQVAAAYRELFLAAGGGALGLFTAIARLRDVHRRLAAALEDAGLALYAQHVDALDTATLVDIFRAEENACLLGTDAVRDGVDVPGRSLRLIVFDRVPWPRPDLLHRARRDAFGGNAYDDMLARLRLKQAYGRLVRRADDRGVFVLLDAAFPSRLAGAFPDAAVPARAGLAEIVAQTRAFFAA